MCACVPVCVCVCVCCLLLLSFTTLLSTAFSFSFSFSFTTLLSTAFCATLHLSIPSPFLTTLPSFHYTKQAGQERWRAACRVTRPHCHGISSCLIHCIPHYPALLSYLSLSRSGEVVGCMPCDKPSLSWYQQLPLSAALRGTDQQQKLQRCVCVCAD